MNTLGVDHPSARSQPSRLSQRLEAMLANRRYVQGLTYILLVAIIWAAASFLVQEIVSEGLKPLVLTYIANSLFVVCLPIYWAKHCLLRARTATRYGGALPETFSNCNQVVS